MKSTVERTDEEELFKIMGEKSPVGVCIMQDGKFCYFNSNFPIAIGYTADELVGKDPLELIVPEDREMVMENEIKMLKGELLSPYQFRVIHKDGSIRWVMEVVRSVQYHGRRAVLGNYMEVTERKQAEETLQAEKNKLQSLIDAMKDTLTIQDTEYNIIYQNEQSRIASGGDHLGEKCYRVYEGREKVCEGCPVEKAFKDGETHTAERMTTIAGKVAFWENTANPIRDAEGKIASCLELTRDITEHKKQAQALADELTRRRLLVDQSLDGIVVLDEDAGVVEANQRFAEMLGYTLEEVRELHTWDWDKIFPPEQLLEMGRNVDEKGLHLETKHTRKDGSVIDVDISISGIMYGGQKLIFCIGRDITERKEMEEALRESEKKLRLISENSRDIICLHDPDHRYVYISPACKEILGYEPDELVGTNPWELVHPEDIEALQKEGQEKALQGMPVLPSYRIRKKSGEYVWFESVSQLLKDGAGNVLGFVTSSRDITERKRAEEALRQSEEKYRTILEEMEDSYFEVDLGGHLTFVNNSVCRDLGYSGEELIGMSYKGFTVEENIESVFRVFNEVYRTGVPNKGFPWETIRKDGVCGFAETSVSTLRNDKGEIIGFRGVGRDITERKRMEEALRQSEENYRALFNSAVIGMVVLDAETMKVVMANQAALNMFGLSSVDEAIALNPIDLIVSEDRERALESTVKDMFEQDLRRAYEFRAMTKDGREIWISTMGARIMQGGKLAGLISFTDITEQKRQSERLMMTDRLASLGELAAGTAHELNNPLTSIIGFSQLLMEKETPDDIREDLKLINNEAQRAVKVTRDLLTFARKHAPVKQHNQINNIIEDVLELRAYEYKANGIEVERHLAPDLPEIMVDYFQMQQVLFNIIINAEYFMTQAHNKGTLTITTKKQNSSVVISIADAGPGILPENLRRIFDPFFTTKEAGSGTGLGLSICHGIVTEHGGQIYVKSQLGKGATIFVELPINSRAHIKSML